MSTIVTGLFEARQQAESALQALSQAGIDRQKSTLIADLPSRDAVRERLSHSGVAPDEIDVFAEPIAGGCALVITEVSEDADADRAVEVLRGIGTIQPEDWDGAADDQEADDQEDDQDEDQEAGQPTLTEAREQVTVGKRTAGGGTAKVRRTVTERPVEKTVTLESQKADLQRRDVDRELSPEEAEQAFKDQTIEVEEHEERPVVEKRARVTGEVTVGTSQTERQETVRDSERQSQVEVERVGKSKSRPT